MHFVSPSVSNTNSAIALYASLSIVDFRLNRYSHKFISNDRSGHVELFKMLF